MHAAVADDVLLGQIPDFVSLPGLMKATPHEDGGNRILYLEASNEDRDHQGEVVLQKALSESSDYFLRHGNIDLSHFTLLGPKLGMTDYMSYEVGRPAAVQVQGSKTFVKAELYQGESAQAKNANLVWDSITRQRPAARWYPSVGGAVLAKSVREDAKTGERVAVVERVRWNNIALDRCPVNATVPEVSMAPLGTFAKSLGGYLLAKDLTAGYGTDAASLTGGAALRKQSLWGAQGRDRISYHDFRERISGAIRGGEAKDSSSVGLLSFATGELGLGRDQAAEFVERFVRDVHSGLKRTKAQ